MHWGPDRVAFEQIEPGSEIAFRTAAPSWTGSAEGSAYPGRVVTIDATEVSVMSGPAGAGRR
jgi:hypothetical protein